VRKDVRDDLAGTLAQALVSVDKIDIIHEEKLHDVMEMFRVFAEMVEKEYPELSSIRNRKTDIE
jgi:hypothetical protein